MTSDTDEAQAAQFMSLLFGGERFQDLYGEISLNEEDLQMQKLDEENEKLGEEMKELKRRNKEEKNVTMEEVEDLERRRKINQKKRLDRTREVSEAEEKEIEKLAERLVQLMQRYEQNGDNDMFERECRVYAKQLAEVPGGPGLLGVVSESYLSCTPMFVDEGKMPFGLGKWVSWGASMVNQGKEVYSSYRSLSKFKRYFQIRDIA